MDGTGDLFKWFEDAVSNTIATKHITYPADPALDYPALAAHVLHQLPQDDDYLLVAESFSGPIALQIAAQHPAHLKGIVLAATFLHQPLGLIGHILEPLLTCSWLYRWQFPPALTWCLCNSANRHPEVAAALSATLRDLPPTLIAHRVQSALNVDCREHFRTCPQPVLILDAAKDHLLADRQARLMQSLSPDASVVTIDAPHLILQCAPAAAAQAILNWQTALNAAQ